MKKKRIANILMVVIILAIVAGGILTAGFIKGWFDSEDDGALLTESIGIITLERNGVSYTVKENTVLRAGDRVSCDTGASAKVALKEGYLTLGENSVVVIDDPDPQKPILKVEKGEVFINTSLSVTLSFDNRSITAKDTVATLSVRKGASSFSIYHGSAEDAKKGEMIEWIGDSRSVTELDINALNDFNIRQLKSALETKELVFTLEMLDELVAQRQAELYNGDTALDAVTDGNFTGTCNITIRCDTILDNMEELDTAKAPFVPSDGCILPMIKVGFNEGETVFDVLNRVCKEYGIQIEYSWTPLYDSYYIEGINNLYEFDCGYESGWMYKVNGWFPNYGCSSYTLTGGETIVWCYTCKGLGEDVGASGW